VTTVLEARRVSKAFGRTPVLKEVDLALGSGEVLGLIGANGSGKTTLLRAVLGLVRLDSGRIEWGETGAATPGDDVVHFGGAHTLPPHVPARTWVRLVSHGEAACADRRPLRALSRGSRQLLGLRAVLGRSALAAAFLDEPWESLDPDGARWLTETLRRLRGDGCAFLVSSHRLHDLAGVCDRYAFLREGRLALRRASDLAPGPVRGADLLRAFDRIEA
jgi:ABC-type multidrug transport system ATPase subunit